MGAAARWALYTAVVAAGTWAAYWLILVALAWLARYRPAMPEQPGLADVEDVIASAIRITREAAP
jgi:hypothetical protein